MSFLKKLGQVLYAGLEITSNFFPILKPFLGSGKVAATATTVVNDLTSIGSVVVQIETALQGQPGTSKITAALPLIANIVRTSELVSGHQVGNEAEFVAGCQDLGNAVVRILNSLKSDSIKTSGGATNVPPAPAAPPVPIVSESTTIAATQGTIAQQ